MVDITTLLKYKKAVFFTHFVQIILFLFFHVLMLLTYAIHVPKNSNFVLLATWREGRQVFYPLLRFNNLACRDTYSTRFD